MNFAKAKYVNAYIFGNITQKQNEKLYKILSPFRPITWYHRQRNMYSFMHFAEVTDLFILRVKTPKTEYIRNYAESVEVSQVLSDLGIHRPHPCGGRGVCGKCKVLLNGSPVLACRTRINKNAVLDITKAFPDIMGITDGSMPDFAHNPMIERGYGAAIDIGTTTIAGYIYSFPECRLVKSACIPNRQGTYGADVMTRLDYCIHGGADILASCLQDAIRTLTAGYEIQKYVICGNTAMLHFLTGQDPASMAVAPYHAEHLFGEWVDKMYLTKCISAFVGGDITAAMTACRMEDTGISLLADIGTNGEMVLKKDDRYFCCSAPAGPCFEGAGISYGTAAIEGAISHVYISGNQIKYSTIGDAPATGLCGTGLVDTIACLLKLGILDENGYMEEDFIFPGSTVCLSCDDVHQFQLAKSAICSGIEALLHEANVSYEEIEKFYIAGGFGTYLDAENAAITGLIPAPLAPKAIPMGNAAGIGASMLLLNKDYLASSEALASSASTLPLTDNPYFAERFIENMYFPTQA